MNLMRTLFQIIFSLFLMSSLLQGQGRSTAGDSRKFKLAPVENVKSSIGPTMDGGRLGVNRLIDGQLPDNGWRSTWTVWMKKNPSIDFDLGEQKRIGVIRIYFQPWDRADELMEVKVEVAEKGKAAWAEVNLRAVKAQYFRITPKYQGWGNQWGEVEFWEINS